MPHLVRNALGGLRGGLEPVLIGLFLFWVAWSLYSNRKQLGKLVDFPLLAAAALLLVFYCFAPDMYMGTVFFAQRWLPIAFILLLLALPCPVVKSKVPVILAVVLCIDFSVSTARAWYLYNKVELSGLAESVEALPAHARIIGLDFVKSSAYIKGRPFLQLYSYAQAYRGDELYFSFAQHMSGIVVSKPPLVRPWSSGLDWHAEKVEPGDFAYFDYALVNASDEAHDELARNPNLSAVTSSGRWRVYRIQGGS